MTREQLLNQILAFSNSKLTADALIEEIENGIDVEACDVCGHYKQELTVRVNDFNDEFLICDECISLRNLEKVRNDF